MITWKRFGIRLAEVWFDEPVPESGIDMVYLIQRRVMEPGASSREFMTILLDLEWSEEQLLGGLKSNTRYEIRRAEKEGLSRESPPADDGGTTTAFCESYNRFAARKGITGLRRSDVARYATAGMLNLSLCRDASGKVVVWHSHVITRGRTRLLHSVSHFDETVDGEYRNRISRANRWLHWNDMLHFKARGFQLYDFGGWYDGATDKAKLGINRFKEQFGGRMVREFNSQAIRSMRGWLAYRIRRIRDRS